MRLPSLVLLGLLALLLCAKPAHAAASYDNCTGFITSVPTVISTPGTWCLKQDVTTAITSGNAVTIAANDVTIDCNDYRLDGLAAGLGNAAFGIYSNNQARITIRHCDIRGFHRGAYLQGTGGGHLVEDNHFDANVYNGFRVEGGNTVSRHNLVTRTGGTTTAGVANSNAIVTMGTADLIDNTISGMTVASGTNGYVIAIEMDANDGGNVVGNTVRGLKPDGTGYAGAIEDLDATRVAIRDNEMAGNGAPGEGVFCNNSTGKSVPTDRVLGNVIAGYRIGIQDCGDAGENDVSP